MVDVSYQMVLSTLQTVGLLMGIYYYVMTLNYTRRNQEETLKTRQATIYQQIIGPLIATPAGIKSILTVQNNPATNIEEHRELCNTIPEFEEAWLWLCNTYESTGVYLQKGIGSIEFFAEFQPYWHRSFWKRAKPIIYELRESMGPSYMKKMEYTMDEVEKYLEEHPELAP